MTKKENWKENHKLNEMCKELCEEMKADTVVIHKRINISGATVYDITGLNKYSELYVW